METFIYTVDSNPENFKRKSYNREIIVYRIKRNEPIYVGQEYVNTASYRGDSATASRIISKELGYKMANGYKLQKSIRLFSI